MKRSRLSGFLGIVSLGLFISSFFFIILLNSFLGFLLKIISTVLLVVLICAILASFFKIYADFSLGFKRSRNPYLKPLGRDYNIFYGILILIFTSIFLVVSLLYSEEIDRLYDALIVYSLWVASGINAIIAGVLYNEKMSEKDRKKEHEHLERKRIRLKKKSEKKGKKLDKIRFDKAQRILNLDIKIKEIENDEKLSEQEKIDKIKWLIDKLKASKF